MKEKVNLQIINKDGTEKQYDNVTVMWKNPKEINVSSTQDNYTITIKRGNKDVSYYMTQKEANNEEVRNMLFAIMFRALQFEESRTA